MNKLVQFLIDYATYILIAVAVFLLHLYVGPSFGDYSPAMYWSIMGGGGAAVGFILAEPVRGILKEIRNAVETEEQKAEREAAEAAAAAEAES